MTRSDDPTREVTRAVARLQASVLALVFAGVCGIGLFTITVWLVVQGGPKVGQHLRLLSHYFMGYSVSWGGAFIGLFWGALAGGIIGWTIGFIYNRVARFRNP